MHHNPVYIKNLSHRYPDGNLALDNINLSIKANEKVALIGANGSGKSTLQFHLNGIFLPQTGEVSIGEWTINDKNLVHIRNFVGVVFQNPDNQLFMPTVWVSPTSNQWILMALIGLIASVAHLFLILSLKYADASKLAPLGYTEIITNILISYYFFHELPDNWTYLGLFIIVLSGLYISRREYLLTRSN